MVSKSRISLQNFLRYCAFLCVSFSVLFRKNDTASALTQVKPSREDFALTELSPEDKEKFLDEHNKFRGMVQPPAADMEYLVSHTNNDTTQT